MHNATQGMAELEFSSNNSYAGEMRDGLLQGTGTYEWADGISYNGAFVGNRASGSGVLPAPSVLHIRSQKEKKRRGKQEGEKRRGKQKRGEKSFILSTPVP